MKANHLSKKSYQVSKIPYKKKYFLYNKFKEKVYEYRNKN